MTGNNVRTIKVRASELELCRTVKLRGSVTFFVSLTNLNNNPPAARLNKDTEFNSKLWIDKHLSNPFF